MSANGGRALTRVFCVALGAWGLWTLVAAAAAPEAPWARVAGLGAAAAIGVGIALLRPPPGWIVAVVAASTGTVVVWGYLRWASAGAVDREMASPFSAANPFGATAAVLTVLAIVAACMARSWWLRGAALVAAAIAGQALVRSGSMGSLIALGCGVVVVLAGVWARTTARVASVATSIVAVAAVAALGAGLAVSALVSSTPGQVADTGLGVDPSNHASEHFEIWADALEVWRTHPLLGAGPGSLPRVARGIEDARSDVVNALAETGLVAAVAWAVALACAAVAVVRSLLRRCRPSTLGLAAATTVLGVYSVVDTTAAWPFLAALLWASAGGLMAVVGPPAEAR